jgi:hypothetical protein
LHCETALWLLHDLDRDDDEPLAEQAFIGSETYFPAVAQSVGLGPARSKMPFVSTGID